MSLKYGLLSILALGIVLLLAYNNYEIWIQPTEVLPKLQSERTRLLEKKKEALPTMEPMKDTLSIQSYISIAEKNIFNPERKDFPALVGTSKPMVRPQVVLYGVTIVGDYQAASVSNPGRPLQRRDREIFTVKLGEKIGEYKVSNISPDRITLEAAGDNFEVLLYDPRIPKRRTEVKTESKPSTVTSILPTPAAPVPETIKPIPPPVSTEAPIPSPSPQIVAPPPSPSLTPGPMRPSLLPRRMLYPPPGAPTQEKGGN